MSRKEALIESYKKLAFSKKSEPIYNTQNNYISSINPDKLIKEKNDEIETLTNILKKSTAFIISNITFELPIIVVFIIKQRTIFKEIFAWLTMRYNNITWLISKLFKIYTYIVSLVAKIGLHKFLNYGISFFVCTAILILIVFLMKVAIKKIKDFYDILLNHYSSETKVLKKYISYSVIVSMAVICILMFEVVRAILPINIVSLWIILSIVSVTIINFKEIKETIYQ